MMSSNNPLTAVTPAPNEALEFLSMWFSDVSEDSLVSIMRIQPHKAGALSIVKPFNEIREAIECSGLDDLIWGSGEIVYDLYFGISTLKTVPPKGKRGGLKNVDKVSGVWIDLDVKEGSFSSQEEAEDLIRLAPLPPTAVVATGQGGTHAYWKFTHPVDCDTGRMLCTRWWALMSDLAHPANIDKLCDPSRIMRLPGSIRWVKKDTEVTSQCSLRFNSDRKYTKNQILDATELVWSAHEERIVRVRASVSKARDEAHQEVVSASGSRWNTLMKIASLEDDFNEDYSWSSILEPMGWTFLGTDDERRNLWSRPGDGVRKSAASDWQDSPHVLSLFSTSEDTGLSDLLDSGIVLTKYRVWVQLFWDGDEKSAIKELLKIKGLG